MSTSSRKPIERAARESTPLAAAKSASSSSAALASTPVWRVNQRGSLFQHLLRIVTHPVAAMILAAICLTPYVYRGWIPHDQGTLAQCAERILLGELPHRDFDDMYTGGLSYLNALAFTLFGVTLSSIRTMFFLFALAFVYVFHWLCKRLLPTGLAALTTCVAVVWSIPNYFAAMPTWYNLFFATFCLAAIVKSIEDRRMRWLALAGFCCGLSVLFKITGLYTIAAVLLFLAYQAHCAPQPADEKVALPKWLSVAFSVTVAGTWVGLVALLTRSQFSSSLFAQLLLPSLVAGAVLVNQSVRNPLRSRAGVAHLATSILVFASGVTAPVVAYVLYYSASGALAELAHGVFVTPFVRLDSVVYPFPEGALVLPITLLLGLLCYLAVHSTKFDLVLIGSLALVAGLLVLLPPILARDVMFLLVRLTPPGLAVACGLKLLDQRGSATPAERQRLYLLLCMAACTPLVQFPFAAPIYFCFVFPLLFLHAQVLYRACRPSTRKVQWAASGLLLSLGLIYLGNFSFFDDPRMAAVDPPSRSLELPRGGILVTKRDKQIYERLVRIIQQHSTRNAEVVAFPDCPEVYFLAERRNASRTLFDLFDGANGIHDPISTVAQTHPDVLVVNCEPKHSRKLTTDEVRKIRQGYRCCEKVGPFLVCFDE